LNYKNKNILTTGGLVFVGSNVANALVELGAIVTIVDSLIPQYGGNLFNINDFREKSKSTYVIFVILTR
jgi:nucleoside-diphosphate-sugar epimerase